MGHRDSVSQIKAVFNYRKKTLKDAKRSTIARSIDNCPMSFFFMSPQLLCNEIYYRAVVVCICSIDKMCNGESYAYRKNGNEQSEKCFAFHGVILT